MHASDRTYLARLGFSDPDKKDSKHDLACQYLAQYVVAFDLLSKFRPPDKQVEETFEFRDEYGCDGFSGNRTGISRAKIKRITSKFEVPISKGKGEYKTTIGFIDVALMAGGSWITEGRMVGKRSTWKQNPGSHYRHEGIWERKGIDEPYHDETSLEFAVVVEVKIGSVSTGEILRQINLYREHATFPNFIVATAFPLSVIETDQLKNAKIMHVVLGPKFEAFCKEQMTSPAIAESMEA